MLKFLSAAVLSLSLLAPVLAETPSANKIAASINLASHTSNPLAAVSRTLNVGYTTKAHTRMHTDYESITQSWFGQAGMDWPTCSCFENVDIYVPAFTHIYEGGGVPPTLLWIRSSWGHLIVKTPETCDNLFGVETSCAEECRAISAAYESTYTAAKNAFIYDVNTYVTGFVNNSGSCNTFYTNIDTARDTLDAALANAEYTYETEMWDLIENCL